VYASPQLNEPSPPGDEPPRKRPAPPARPLAAAPDPSDGTDTAAPRPRLVAIIPAYNEDKYIASVVLKARREVDRVVVVDDGSCDRTGKAALVAGDPRRIIWTAGATSKPAPGTTKVATDPV
jgi:hypothetical protein